MFHKDNENNPFKEHIEEEINEEMNKETNETEEAPAEEGEEKTPAQETAEGGLKEEYEDLNNKYIRLAADFDNFRKRQMNEREHLIKYGAEDTLKKIITVLDTFERAKKSVENMEECQKVKESYDVCIKQLYDTLDKIGLKKIEAKGETFDPNLHEAVMQTPTDEYPEHTIIDELQTGYKLYDKVLRASLVNVATEGSKNNDDNKEEQ